MQGLFYKVRKGLFLMLLVIVFLTGCSNALLNTGTLEKVIDAYWTARLKGDFSLAFNYERISLYPERFSKEVYVANAINNRNKMQMKGFKLIDIEYLDDNNAVANIEYTYTISLLGFKGMTNKPITSIGQDKWQKIDGRWYHIISGFSGTEEY